MKEILLSLVIGFVLSFIWELFFVVLGVAFNPVTLFINTIFFSLVPGSLFGIKTLLSDK